MNINRKIEDALGSLVDNNIWPLSKPGETKFDNYIVYRPENEKPASFADDEDQEWQYRMEINWYARNSAHTPVNCQKVRKQIRKALRAAEFTVESIVEGFEKDTGYTYLTVICSILEDDPYGEN